MIYTKRGAQISHDQKYRYVLFREWEGTHAPRTCIFIMLNPSTADGEKDDPTIRKCVSFAHKLGCNRLDVVNLFAYRTSSPKALKAVELRDDPVGPFNDGYIDAAIMARDALIICAWGNHGEYLGRGAALTLRLTGKVTLHAIDITQTGQPKHPLYIPGAMKLVPYPKK